MRPGFSILMGLVWAALLFAATSFGSVALALVVAPVAVVAGVSGVRAVSASPRSAARRRAGTRQARRPGRNNEALTLAALAGVVLPAAALGGGVAAVAVGVVFLVVSVVWLFVTSPRGFSFLLVLAELGPAVAAASVVAARGQGGSQALTLLVAICLYDMANFLTGTGRRGGVAGTVVGMITVAIFAVLVAAVVVPPFSGDSPWILFGTVACLAPVGIFIMGRIGPSLRLPAVRRLDSLLLAGPAWVIAVHLVLH